MNLQRAGQDDIAGDSDVEAVLKGIGSPDRCLSPSIRHEKRLSSLSRKDMAQIEQHVSKVVTVLFMSHRVQAKVFNSDTMETFLTRVSVTASFFSIFNELTEMDVELIILFFTVYSCAKYCLILTKTAPLRCSTSISSSRWSTRTTALSRANY